jgi:regulator of sigma E protease
MSSILSTAISIIEFILIFGLMIFLHEFGHFITGKLFKVKVEEFGFGYPPRLKKLFNFKGTDITLNWIPFGGFTRFSGETDPNVPGSLASEKPWKRLIILSSGAIMNLLTGILIFSLVFVKVGAPDSTTVQILSVDAGSPAASAGLEAGDIIESINGQPVNSMTTLSGIVQKYLDQQITLTYLRDGQNYQTSLVPRSNPPQGEGAMGIVMTNPVKPISWFQAVPYAGQVTVQQVKQLILLPSQLIRGQIQPSQARILGPVGIYDVYSQAQQLDQQAISSAQPSNAVNVLWIWGIISVAIGLTNLLPIPALDGGRILFVLAEIVFRKRVPPEYENLIHLVGFAALILLMVYVTVQDVLNPVVLP